MNEYSRTNVLQKSEKENALLSRMSTVSHRRKESQRVRSVIVHEGGKFRLERKFNVKTDCLETTRLNGRFVVNDSVEVRSTRAARSSAQPAPPENREVTA
ncbi:hypothetical protein BV898_19568 [Hypsibius exemplaris]|uniref:Uncharacterized protein n=1 Tax=Hypsibius exemplaris TaxID=2072580 RepID=A0A9X6NQY9_HYPEX|nr:hypothetical protein BV898_19568 [Hypsibius exemplaris]